jgi:hypothetical protein
MLNKAKAVRIMEMIEILILKRKSPAEETHLSILRLTLLKRSFPSSRGS